MPPAKTQLQDSCNGSRLGQGSRFTGAVGGFLFLQPRPCFCLIHGVRWKFGKAAQSRRWKGASENEQ